MIGWRAGVVGVALTFAGLGLVGCGHAVEYTPLSAAPRPLQPRSPETVDVYLSARPERPTVDVGLFEIEQRTPMSGGSPSMIRKLREQAAIRGCDAVLVADATERVVSTTAHTTGTVQRTGNANHGTYSGTTSYSENRVRGHRAVCLAYRDAVVTTSAPLVGASQAGQASQSSGQVAPSGGPVAPSGGPVAPLPPSMPPATAP